MSFKIQDFLDPGYVSAESFLSRHRGEFGTLGEMLSALLSFSDVLKKRLTLIIHNNYSEFVSISKKLLQLGDNTELLVKSLKDSEKEIKGAINEIMRATEPIRAQKENLSSVQSEIRTCETAIAVIDVLQSLDASLESHLGESIDDLFDAAVLLSANRVKMLSIDQPALSKPISQALERVSDRFVDIVKGEFVKSIKDGDGNRFDSLISIGLIYGIEFYSVFSSEFIEKRLKGMDFNQMLEFVPTELEVVSHCPSLDFVAFSFAPVLASEMNEKFSFVCTSIPQFIEFYTKFNSLVSTIEGKCKSLSSIRKVRSNFSSVSNKLSLQMLLYVQLVTGKVLETPNIEQVSGKFKLSITNSFVSNVSYMWDTCFIPEMRKQFAELYLRAVLNFTRQIQVPKSLQPYYLSDLLKLRDLTILPEEFRAIEELGHSEFSSRIDSLKSEITSDLVDLCSSRLVYIQTLGSRVGSQKKTPSVAARTVMEPYADWTRKSGINDTELAANVTDGVFKVFYKESSQCLDKMRKGLESIMKLRGLKETNEETSKMFDISGVIEQLQIDIKEISSFAKMKKVQLDDMDSYNQLKSLLSNS